jgi:tRNA-dihydrouridine synthase B
MLRIGRIQLDLPVVQAALAGYSDEPMRLVARRHGAPYALTELVLDKLYVQSAGRDRRSPVIPAEDRPIGGQLMGAEPGPLAQAAAMMATRGFDVVDLNFACPGRKVLGRQRGGFLLSDPSTAIEIIRAVRAAVPTGIPVTLKLRRGMDGSSGSERDFFLILDAAFEHGLAAVTVHGRTVAQRYVGPSNWGFLARVKRHVGDQTVLGSGDLFDAEGIRRMLEQTGVDGVTVARGCIGNPWVFRDARSVLSGQPLPDPPSVAEQGRVIREHFELCEAHHGPRRASRIMRKFGIRYSELHPFADKVRTAFIRSRCRDDWLNVLEKWYAPTRSWPPTRRQGAPGDLVAAGARR